jgi:chemotaxis protein histidine kinase CheA
VKISSDPFVQELLPEFVDTWMNDIKEQYPKLIEEKNSVDIYRIAHTLKGSCFQFGLDEIAYLGIELMEFCKAKDWENITNMESRLVNMFEQFKTLLEKP